MWKFVDMLMVLSALGTFVFLFMSFRDRGNRKLVQLRELFTGLFFLFWGLGDILNRDSPTFGAAFVGLGIIWLMLSLKEYRKRKK